MRWRFVSRRGETGDELLAVIRGAGGRRRSRGLRAVVPLIVLRGLVGRDPQGDARVTLTARGRVRVPVLLRHRGEMQSEESSTVGFRADVWRV